MGTYGGALEARQVKASDGRLAADVTGEVETADDGVLILKRIHVILRLKAGEASRETAELVAYSRQRSYNLPGRQCEGYAI